MNARLALSLTLVATSFGASATTMLDERWYVAPALSYVVADTDRASARAYPMLQQQIPPISLVTIDNEHIVRGELPPAFARGRVMRVAALPVFLKTYIDRLTFSFTGYLRNEKDSSTELHQWIRENYFSFRELELNLLLQRS